jgi:hypothetical protein
MASKIIRMGRSEHDLERSQHSDVSALPDDWRKGGGCEPVPLKGAASVGGTIDGECVLVPPGEYELRYRYYETLIYRRSPRLIVHLAIVAPDEYAGLPVERFYNVEKLTGPAKRYGDFVARRRGDLVREYRQIAGPTGRHDRLSFVAFKGQRIVGQIITVTTDHRRRELPEDEYYSKVDRLIRVLPHE